MRFLQEAADIDTPTGVMRTHVFRPQDETRTWPALLLYSEIFQMTGPIKRTAQLFAGHGYVVAVPEVYHESLEKGVALTYTPEDTQRGNDLKAAKPAAAWDSDLAALVAWLQACPHVQGDKLGVAGMCLGGGLAMRAALHPAIKVAVSWYGTDIHKRSLGVGDDTIDRFGEVKGELLLIWGRGDPHVNAEGRAAVYAALSAANVRFTWHEVDGVHAFLRDENSFGRYDPALAFETYGLALAALGRVLK